MWSDDNAASSVLAVVLMMGFVAAASVSLFVVGTATLTDTQNSAEDSQVENTFREFDKDVASVAYGRQKYRTNNFEIQSDTAAFRQKDTGNIQIIVDGTVEVDKDVGALVYEKDGTTIAYQAGGVWSGTGEDSRMVSKPPVEYQNGSLTFPIPVLGGEETLRSGELDIKKTGTKTPLNDKSFYEGSLVKLKITSEYYMGWAEYFRKQTNDVAVEVDHNPPGPEGTVTVNLGRPVANGDFQDGVMATGGDDGDIVMGGGNPGIDGSVSATGDIQDPDDDITGNTSPNQDSNLYELDEAINRKVEDAKTNASIANVDVGDGTTELKEGNVYFDDDGFSLSDNGDTVNVNLSDGNVTLIVDGDMELTDGDINIDAAGTDNAFRIYSTGDIGMKNAFAGDKRDWEIGHSASSAKHLQVYGQSDMLVGFQGGSTRFVGTIYAPRKSAELGPNDPNTALPNYKSECDGYDVCIYKGSSAVKGSIVAGPTKFANGAEMTYDSSIENLQPTMELEDGVLPPPITFLRVSVHEVEINNSDDQNVMPAASIDGAASFEPVAATSALETYRAGSSPMQAQAATVRRETTITP